MNRYARYSHIQPTRKIPLAVTDLYHTLREFETIDQLAQTYYNDPTLEWVIMCANPDFFLSFAIPAGTVLRIPYPLDRVFKLWGESGDV